jgi:hypothetical protein
MCPREPGGNCGVGQGVGIEADHHRSCNSSRVKVRTAPSSSLQSDVLRTMVGPSKKPTTHESQKKSLGGGQITTLTATDNSLHSVNFGAFGGPFQSIVVQDDLIVNAGGSVSSLHKAVSQVPGPIVGAGLPGVVAACGGLLALARRRRRQSA